MKHKIDESMVPILAKIWQEDDVWNVSAFDLPVVAFGNTLKQAQRHFEDAIDTHFAALHSLDRLQQTIAELQDIAVEAGFYQERMTPRVTVQNFPYNAINSLSACHVG